MTAVLEAAGVSVTFGGLSAVKDVSLEVDAGSVVGVIGPNGAGKSTFFNAITGHQATSAGRIVFRGWEVTGLSAHQRARLGMARTFQLGGLIGTLTVLENVILGSDQGGRSGSTGRGRREARRQALEVLERFQLERLAGELTDNLPAGTKRQIEVARAISAGAHFILLDEPGVGLSEGEQVQLSQIVRRVASDGAAVLLTDHTMDLDRVNVMDFGQLIATGTPDEVSNDERVRSAYLGHE